LDVKISASVFFSLEEGSNCTPPFWIFVSIYLSDGHPSWPVVQPSVLLGWCDDAEFFLNDQAIRLKLMALESCVRLLPLHQNQDG
jgi:hypothetical protein